MKKRLRLYLGGVGLGLSPGTPWATVGLRDMLTRFVVLDGLRKKTA